MKLTGTIAFRRKRDWTRITDEIVETFKAEVRDQIVADFNDITRDWETDVTFDARIEVQGKDIVVGIGPRRNAKIWIFVDQGTRAHAILPRRTRALRFRTGYNAHTQPGRAHAGSGRASGPVRFARAVWHPGTTARDFTTTLMEKWKPTIADMLKRTIREAS